MGPTPWISNLVVVPKGQQKKDATVARRDDQLLHWKPRQPEHTLVPTPIKVRLTCDSKSLNKAVRRQRFPVKSLEDIVQAVNGAKVFSKLDLTKAFHQLELAKESRHLTTIVTHKGLFRYRRLHMGISSASEVFTDTIRSILAECPGQLNMTDDVLVFGSTVEEHERNLLGVLEKLEASGITLNTAKCEFFRTELTFFGMRFSTAGVSPTLDRCKALREAGPPKNVKELRSLIGMAQYSARFISDMASITEPLWRLTKDGAKWTWSAVEQRALDELKNAITTSCLSFFDRDWDTEVIVDASPVGLGAVLAQVDPNNKSDRRVICFASRLLTQTERRYSQCEKEALAAVWGCERFWLYLFGKQFTLVTDNRAVQLIFGNSASRPPARIERWALRLTQFDFSIVHRPGKSNVADYFSRNPDRTVDLEPLVSQQLSERYINAIVSNAMTPALTRREVAKATQEDEELCELADWLTKENRAALPAHLGQYKHLLDELSQAGDGILLRGTLIVIPRVLRERVAELAHKGHQGIVQSKALIRSRVWYPGIDAQVERKVRECVFCQANSSTRTYEPLKPTPMPDGPWQSVAGDFFGPMADGTYYLVSTCLYSRWFDVKSITSTNADTVTSHLEELFATFGAPHVYMTDNGPPFNSHAFTEFAERLGFVHRKTTPLWPRANGAVESVMKKLGRVVKVAKATGVNKQQVLRDFLRVYRDTPHTSTKVAPSDLMFGFGRTSGLPRIEPDESQRTKWRTTARDNDNATKERMEREYNARMSARPSKLVIGSRVLLNNSLTRKPDTHWNPTPYVVTHINGTQVTAARPDHVCTRNSSFFKLLVEQRDNACNNEPNNSSTENGGEKDRAPALSPNAAHEATKKQEQPTVSETIKRRVGRPTKAETLERARGQQAASSTLHARASARIAAKSNA